MNEHEELCFVALPPHHRANARFVVADARLVPGFFGNRPVSLRARQPSQLDHHPQEDSTAQGEIERRCAVRVKA